MLKSLSRQGLLFNPFAQAAGLFILFGLAMVLARDRVWELSLVEVALFSVLCPVFTFFKKEWWKETYQANMAVILLWISALGFAALTAASGAGPRGKDFLLPAVLYAYTFFLTGLIRLFYMLARKLRSPAGPSNGGA